MKISFLLLLSSFGTRFNTSEYGLFGLDNTNEKKTNCKSKGYRVY